jgi:hypothetical protein
MIANWSIHSFWSTDAIQSAQKFSASYNKGTLSLLWLVIIVVTKFLYAFPIFIVDNSYSLDVRSVKKEKAPFIFLTFKFDTKCYNFFFAESILARRCWRTPVVHQWFNKCQGNDILTVCFIYFLICHLCFDGIGWRVSVFVGSQSF